MRLPSRTRRIAKWTGLVVCIVIVAVGAASVGWCFSFESGTPDDPGCFESAEGFVFTLANGVAMFLCLLLVEEVSPWVVFIGATIGAILGNLTARRFFDGMMFTMIAAIVTWLAFLFLPLPLLLRQAWLSFGGGICTAKMLVGGYREFRD